MKMQELLREADDYLDELKSFIIDLLVAFRANGIEEVDFDKFLADVQRAGFVTADQDFLVDFLGTQTELVSSSDPSQNKIIVAVKKTRPDETDEEEPAEEQPDKVSQDAAQHAKAAVKDATG